VVLGNVNDKALAELGWATLCAELSARAHTPMGRARCLALLPGDDPAQSELHLARIEEARALHRREREVPLSDALDVRTAVGRAAREGTLPPESLLQIARLIRAAGSARRFGLAQRETAPLHADLAAQLSELDPLAAELERAFDPAGKLLDTASALLAELRERARGLHRAVKARLEEMLKDEELVPMLRDAYYSVRGDRYVLPVRAEHKSHVPGVVHNASGSGQTLFIEPQELMELGNQLTIAESGILEEEQRILGELSGAVGRQAERLIRDVELLGELDEVAAGARLAERLSATAPALGAAERDSFVLKRLRHPLLALQVKARAEADAQQRSTKVVANDVALPEGARGLIVSGPNAGGKTVTITAVGLCALMARAGLPIPAAEGSRLPLYRTVYTAIGDEGDLSRNLSTFTAHLASLRLILEAAGPGTLVLIDEIAADTDPREGAAIAIAALERLVDAGATVLITTHLEELKALGLADPRFASASVGFDVEKLAPTYQLTLGEVGASSAIEIARRVGLPGAVCDRARTLLGGGGSQVSMAVEKLEHERAATARERAALLEERQQLEGERGELEQERERLRAAEREVRQLARGELIADLERKYQEASALVAKLQAAPAMSEAVQAQRQLKSLIASEQAAGARETAVAEGAEEARTAEAEREATPQLKPGARVRHVRLGSEGVLLDVSGGQATVQLGALRTKVPVEELVPLARRAQQGDGARFKKTAAEKLSKAEAARAAPVVSRLPTIDAGPRPPLPRRRAHRDRRPRPRLGRAQGRGARAPPAQSLRRLGEAGGVARGRRWRNGDYTEWLM
jgi:DNA mismatch repair protein MutS2